MKPFNEPQDFLESINISAQRLQAIYLDPQILIAIAKDYENSKDDLLDEVEHIAKRIQRCKYVHSVRSSIKETNELIDDIIFNKEAHNEQYSDINVSNYKSKIQNLIEVKAIYLFKQDWLPVHEYILSKWTPLESVKVYHRLGDALDLYQGHENCKLVANENNQRAIRYVIPTSEKIGCKIQTQTIFEDAYNEIEQRVHSPNAADNSQVKNLLNVLNNLVGNADEMGRQALSLSKLLKTLSTAKEVQLQQQEKIKQLEEQLKNTAQTEKNTVNLEDSSYALEKAKAPELEKAKAPLESISDLYTNQLPLSESIELPSQQVLDATVNANTERNIPVPDFFITKSPDKL